MTELALIVAGAGFRTLNATPFVTYPTNPPAVGHDEAIGDRSGFFLVMIAGSVVALLPSPGQLATNVATYGPVATETPQPLRDPTGRIVFPGFDPDLLYSFRLHAITEQILPWGVLGLVFGALAERAAAKEPTERALESV